MVIRLQTDGATALERNLGMKVRESVAASTPPSLVPAVHCCFLLLLFACFSSYSPFSPFLSCSQSFLPVPHHSQDLPDCHSIVPIALTSFRLEGILHQAVPNSRVSADH